MSTPPPSIALDRRREMHPPQNPHGPSENGDYGGERENRSHGKEKRSRSRSKDHGRTKEKDRERDKDKSRRKRDRSRDRRRGSKERDRVKSKERSERPKSKERDRERDRERGDRERQREGRGSEREKDVAGLMFGNGGGGGGERDRRKKDRERGDREKDHDRRRNSRERERERETRTRRSRSRNNDEQDGRRSHSNRQERSRSRSHERHRREYERERELREREFERQFEREFEHVGMRDRERERSTTVDRERERMEREAMRLTPVKEEMRESRFDLTQTIHELMTNSSSTKNYASLFNCTNSNDSFGKPPSENSQDDTERKRKRKSRWGGTENDKTFIPGMPTILPSTLDPSQQEAYLVQLQIEEISRKLRTGDLGIPQNPEERSPSPEPIYSSDGKRLNTREFRFRKRLEEQRHQLIQKMQSVNPEFKPPADYKPPVTRVSDKVLIPQEQHPDINFVGLLIGPRGNTLKAMEKETGAKIIIRGKGSVKEGKVGRKDGQPLPGEDEPLHAFITAPNPDAVRKAVDKIKDVIRQGIEVPEGHNDLRRMQLRELAQLNGTLRETDCQRCTNCGSSEHKSWLCPDKPNVTNNIVCTACGGAGHLSRDCRSKRPGGNNGNGNDGIGNSEDSQAKIDEEYMSLMAELGEGPPPSAPQRQNSDPLVQVHLNRGYSIFDKKPTQMQAIQGSNRDHMSSSHSMHGGGGQQSSSMPTGWGNGNGGIPPLIPPPPQTMQPAPPPLMSWMPSPQPPPPGGDPMSSPLPPPPPGTGPLPQLIPPPPPGTQAPMPPWSSYGGWGAGAGGYLPPPPPGTAPPPPPCAPPPPPPPM